MKKKKNDFQYQKSSFFLIIRFDIKINSKIYIINYQSNNQPFKQKHPISIKQQYKKSIIYNSSGKIVSQ